VQSKPRGREAVCLEGGGRPCLWESKGEIEKIPRIEKNLLGLTPRRVKGRLRYQT